MGRYLDSSFRRKDAADKNTPVPLLENLRKNRPFPGWVDLQVNGHSGISFCDGNLTLEAVAEATERLREAGTDGFLATLVTTPPEVMTHCLRILGKACANRDLSRTLLGIHLEGPFLSAEPGAKGAHPPQFMGPPDWDTFRRFQDAAQGQIRLLTLAPELPGAIPFIERVSQEVVCSAGHTLAGFETLKEAVRAGLRLGTHIGNGVPAQIHRHDNPIIAQLAIPEITPSFITDGFHVPESFIRAVLAAKGPAGCFAVSDQTHLAGMPPGEYALGVTPVVLEPSGFLRMRDEPYLAGSSCTMAQCMKFLAGLNILDDSELIKLGYTTPLRILGKDEL